MKQYEITFIIDPVLPGDEVQKAAKAYEKLISKEGCEIVHIDDMGLKQLAYPINRKNSGVYKCIEFKTEDGSVVSKLELALRRDERIMRFLTVKLDKYGVKYNEDKRNGLIGKRPKSDKEQPAVAEKAPKREDLTIIEGIGPKIAQLLNSAGINSYAQLAASTPNEIKSILSKGGPSFTGHNPETWPDQSQLSAHGKWADLNAMKDKLIGGIDSSSSEEE